MTQFTVTGVVPTPRSNPDYPVHDLHESTPKGKARDIGESGRTVSVTTESPWVAEQLASIFSKVYADVTVDPPLPVDGD